MERFKIDRYIQNHVIDGAFGVLPTPDHRNKVADRDGVVELHFSEFRDLLATLEPEGVTAVPANQDGRFFADEPDQHHRHGGGERTAGGQPAAQVQPRPG